MPLTIAFLFLALHLVSASRVPQSEELSEEHLVHLDGPVLDPAAIASHGLSTRATGNVYICINRDWSPACTTIHMPNDECYTFGNPWEDTISSWGPDPGVSCHVYERRDCDIGGRMFANIEYPGYGNLNDFQFEDIISSARCWYW